jgi:hypothetical protein
MSLVNPRNWMVLKTEGLIDSGEDIDINDAMALYVLGLYLICQTITTVGYGDVNPANTLERIYLIFVMLVGVFSFGFISSALTSLMHHHDEKVLQDKKAETMLQTLHSEYEFDETLFDKMKKLIRIPSKTSEINRVVWLIERSKENEQIHMDVCRSLFSAYDCFPFLARYIPEIRYEFVFWLIPRL